MPTTRTRPVNQVDRMFRAFADRTRLRILHLLQTCAPGGEEHGDLCVSDIIDILRLPQAKASHHLNYLRRAGLVDARKEGLWCFYKLRPADTPFHQKLLECLGQCFAGVPGLAADRARAAKIRASGGCCPRRAPGGCGPQ
jgi:ArsR family transcriptional regulator